MSTSDKVMIMIPSFWGLFKIYLNNQSYYVRSRDILSTLFMKGEDDVKEFISKCNKVSLEKQVGIKFKYKRQLTYRELLNQLTQDEQI